MTLFNKFLDYIIVKEKDILWRLINNNIPLVDDDFSTYLLKDGTISEEDLKAWKESTRLIYQAYNKLDKSRSESLTLLSSALEKLNSIKPKKPLPPDAKIRFEEVKNNVTKVVEILKGKSD
jgi:hypothetical protein